MTAKTQERALATSIDSRPVAAEADASGERFAVAGASVSTKQLLFVIIVVAVLLRLLSAFYQGNTVVDLPGIYDQISYHGLAQRVVEGHGFSFAEGHWPATRAGEPTAHWSYLYTLYLVAVYAAVGVQPLVARVIQAVIVGILQPWLVYRIGRRVFGVPVGVLAAAFSAVYIYFFYYAGGLLTESFYFIGILWTLDAAMRIAEQRDRPLRWRLWVELGLAIGLTGLLRQVFLLFAPFLFLWIWWNLSTPAAPARRSIRQFLRSEVLLGMASTVVVVVLLIAPWTIRNYRAFHTFVPLNTNAGFAFYWGNHPIHSTNFIPLLPVDGPSYRDLIPPHLLPLNEGALDRALLTEAVNIVMADPLRYGLLSLTRTKEYFKFWPSSDSSSLSNISRVGSFGIFLPFMIYGLWVSARYLRNPQNVKQRSQVALLYLFMTLYTFVHLMSWTLIRYRLPVDTVLLVFAALGVAEIYSWLRWFRRLSDETDSKRGLP
jgi:hypothetical protein